MEFFVMGSTEDGDAYVVNVQSASPVCEIGYRGTNVIFYRNGLVVGDCFGRSAEVEWTHHRDEIIETARSGQCGLELGKFMRGEPCGDLVP